MAGNNYNRGKKMEINKFLVFILFASLSWNLNAQSGGRQGTEPKITFGIHADPLISWFSSDIDSVRNDGARAGFNFGLNVYRYFGPNYAISTGISIISAGGRLVSKDTTIFDISHDKDNALTTVIPNEAIVYKVQYISIPIGLKLQTNQIGYITYFADLGLDPKIIISNKVDIPASDIDNQKAMEEVSTFNISYHVMAGIEYAVGGKTAIVLGLCFDNNFADITRDIRGQFDDKISHKMLSIRLGVNF
jgi:hypothetical protein